MSQISKWDGQAWACMGTAYLPAHPEGHMPTGLRYTSGVTSMTRVPRVPRQVVDGQA
jgi:hypothetical protein